MENKETVTINITTINEMINYIKNMVVMEDHEWGQFRTIEKIIEDGDMPDLYYKLINMLSL